MSARAPVHPIIRFSIRWQGCPARRTHLARGAVFYLPGRTSPRGQEQNAPFFLPRSRNLHRATFLACRFGHSKNVSKHDTKPLIPVTVVRVVIVAIRTAGIPIIIVERTTTQHARLLSLRPSSRTGEALGV